MTDDTHPTKEPLADDATAVRDRDALNDPTMTLVVVGCMLLLVLLVVAIVVAGQRPPGGI